MGWRRTAVKAAGPMVLLLTMGAWTAAEAQAPGQASPGATLPPFPSPSPTSGEVRNVAGQPGLPPIVSGEELLTKHDKYRERIEAKVAETALSLAWDEAPQVTRRTLPAYPPSAFVTKTEGTVLVMFVVGDTGRVSDVEVLESRKGLDDAAEACVKSWRFKPARKQGQPVATLAVVAVEFRIY
jgi:bla regulator protein blaR1